MYTADTWPIAAKMNFGSRTETGEDIGTAPVSIWEDQLLQVKELGFGAIDPMDDWVPLVEISEERFASFRDMCRDLDLSIPAISVGRRSVVDVRNGDTNLAFVHDLIDRGHELGAQVINIGFMEALTPAQEKALWFWLAPGGTGAGTSPARRPARNAHQPGNVRRHLRGNPRRRGEFRA